MANATQSAVRNPAPSLSRGKPRGVVEGLVPSAVEGLSERAQILIHQMLDRHIAAASIARTISHTTHEKISPEAISRYAKTYAETVQAKENARQRTTYIVGEILRRGGEVSDLLRAAFLESFTWAHKTGALTEMDPLLFEAAERKRREMELKEKRDSVEMGLKERNARMAERRLKVFEERLKLDGRKAQAAIDRLDRKARQGKSLTVEDVDQIREIYGLDDASAPKRHSAGRASSENATG